ncbi:hypothetical protein [Actinomadura macrotermitis]|uniref:Uncharacterized protein n=1 Tax=Actinomadura macrotermitis TaxID=2585200 RepID=A0A7K0C042_9ACTN|nr:hypothetical protein [Actinomadura macrotermitis]MQY06244.1 hypothetical protein [Actinomadura macrotermitis]
MTPEETAAELDRRYPDWAIIYGTYTHHFIALPLTYGHVVAATTAYDLQRLLGSASARSDTSH